MKGRKKKPESEKSVMLTITFPPKLLEQVNNFLTGKTRSRSKLFQRAIEKFIKE